MIFFLKETIDMNKSDCTLFFQAVLVTENTVIENITKFNVLIVETCHILSESYTANIRLGEKVLRRAENVLKTSSA